MSASRLPGKMLADLNGAPVIERLVSRLQRSRRLDAIILATTINPADDALESWSTSYGIPCFRGSEDDVLDRVVAAQASQSSDVVVEICGDCPLVDPEVVDLAIDTYFANEVDVVTTTQIPSWPQGIDVQVFSFAMLADVAGSIFDPAVREHVSLYFYENPERFRIHHLLAPASDSLPDQRCQLDYPEDLEFLREVCSRLDKTRGTSFSVRDLCHLLMNDLKLRSINASCEEKPVR